MTETTAPGFPVELDLDHVEFHVDDLDAGVAAWVDGYGFSVIGRAGSPQEGFRGAALRQGRITLVLTEATAEEHPARRYVETHGDGVARIALRTSDVRVAFDTAVARGARPLAYPVSHEAGGPVATAAIGAFGDLVHTFVQRSADDTTGLPEGYSPVSTVSTVSSLSTMDTSRTGLLDIDHFAVAVPVGELTGTIGFYRDVLGFREIFAEHIVVGDQAMNSKVVQSRSGTVTFTVLEPDPVAAPGQIDDFVKTHDGAGIQHLAFSTHDVVRSVRALGEQGIEFLSTPTTYYELLAGRITVRHHDLADLRDVGVLVDEDHHGQLFQIFTRSAHPRRTLFFEVIERFGAKTFGSSNIRALYEAVEAERGERHPLANVFCVGDAERLAAEILTADVRDFVAGGSGGELTMAANRAALDSVWLEPRVLRDVEHCRTDATLLGTPAALPIATAPIAYQRLVHPDGEIACARAARTRGIPFSASILSSVPVERITEVGGTVWFQLYWLRDRAATFAMVRRAEDAGCTALMLTVDVPWMGRRLRDLRGQFALPPHVTAANFPAADGAAARQAGSGGSAVATHTELVFAPSLTWRDLDELRARTSLPLVVKGILAPEDAVRAVDHGADAVVVSNHGGRQLDGAVASADRLEAVCAALHGRCQVLLDSGIRSGLDVLKALALGADGVLVGRPLLWGLAAGGEAGVAHVLSLLAAELRCALGLAGCDRPTTARQLRTFRAAWEGAVTR